MKKTVYYLFLAIGVAWVLFQLHLVRQSREWDIPDTLPQQRNSQKVEKDGTLPKFSSVPAFSLIERSGKAITQHDLKGKIWLADFIFTNCPDICPLMGSRLSGLQEKAFASGQVGFLSFSVDPANDTPEILREYADHLQARPEWLFVTGNKGQIERIAKSGFLLAFKNENGLPEQVSHSSKIALVDRNGFIRRFYEGVTKDESAKMLADIETLLHEGETP